MQIELPVGGAPLGRVKNPQAASSSPPRPRPVDEDVGNRIDTRAPRPSARNLEDPATFWLFSDADLGTRRTFPRVEKREYEFGK